MRDGQRKYEIYNTLEVKNLKGSGVTIIGWICCGSCQSCCEEDSRFSLVLQLAGKGQLGLCNLGPVLSLLKLLLSLPELGEVKSSNLLSLLNLLLVGLDLCLELLGQFRHLVLVLVVLLLLELQFLDAPLRLLEGLVGIRCLALDTSQLNLHLPDARFQLGHGISATLSGCLIGLSPH